MIDFFQKLHRFGYRRAIVYVLIRCAIGVKAWLYRYLISDNTPQMVGSKVMTPTQFIGKGTIKIKNAQLGVWPSPYVFKGGYLEARSPESSISIGQGTVINNNFSIIADKTNVSIGDRCLIGPNFFVVDSDFHGINISDRSSGVYEASSVVIFDDVFIGDNVRVLKGVTIGVGSVIGSGSLVTKDIAPYSVAVGVPAKIVRIIGEK